MTVLYRRRKGPRFANLSEGERLFARLNRKVTILLPLLLDKITFLYRLPLYFIKFLRFPFLLLGGER